MKNTACLFIGKDLNELLMPSETPFCYTHNMSDLQGRDGRSSSDGISNNSNATARFRVFASDLPASLSSTHNSHCGNSLSTGAVPSMSVLLRESAFTLHSFGCRSAVDGLGGAIGTAYPSLFLPQSRVPSPDFCGATSHRRCALCSTHDATHRCIC